MDAFEVYSTGAGQTPLSRIVARASGTDPIAFLDATTTQDLTGLKPGSGALTCLLDEKGRVLAEMRALALDDGTVLLDMEEAARPALEYLARVAPLSGCSVIDETRTVIAVRGVRAGSALASFEPLPSDEHAFVERDGAVVVRVEWGPLGYDVLASEEPSFAVDQVSFDDFEGARVDAGVPRFGVDVDESTHIAETPLIERAVSFTKGCYPGQESVARVRNLGRPRKKLVVLDVDGTATPGAGATVREGDAEVGVVTSAARYGGTIVAMARVRSELEAGGTVGVGDAKARVRA